MFLADAAPTGAGLAIVGVILLAFLAFALAVVVLLIRAVVRRAKGPGIRPIPAAGGVPLTAPEKGGGPTE